MSPTLPPRRYVLFACAASLLALSGCTGHQQSAAPERPAASASPRGATPSASSLTGTRWRDPAEALTDAKVWVATGRRSGGLQLALPANPGRGTVWVATECQGTGVLTVDTGRYGTYTERCSDHPDGSLNAFEATAPEPATLLKVTAGPGVTWAVAIGRNNSRVPRAGTVLR